MRGSPSLWIPFEKALGQAELRFTAQVGYFGAGRNFRASAWVVIDGKLAESFKRSPTQMDFKQSIWRFRQTVNSLPSFPPMGRKTGIRWTRLVWKSNDLSSVSQRSKKAEELARVEELRDRF